MFGISTLVYKWVGVLLVIAILCGLVLYERGEKLDAEKAVVELQGTVALRDQTIVTQSRAIVQLGNSTAAAKVEAKKLREQHARESAPMVAKIAKLEADLADKTPSGKTAKDAIDEWRNGK